jgi:squalene-hopene/tetraprenyl-beta-curcumene cyclase
LLKTQRVDGSWPVEVHLSIWNTTRAIEALKFSSENSWDTEKTVEWLLAQQTQVECVYSGAKPGGWGWNHCSGSVPDADDTAGVLLALKQLSYTALSPVKAVERGLEWLLRLQNRNGGWPTFCRGWEKLPFDRSAPDLTAHVLRAFSAWKNDAELKDDLRKTLELASIAGWYYLATQQRIDGSFAPLWFGCEHAPDQLNAAYGTCQVLLACAEEKMGKNIPMCATGGLPSSDSTGQIFTQLTERAIGFLEKLQNPDGSFGGSPGAAGTVEETGLCLRALCAQGWNFSHPRARAAAQWLIDRQRADGSWDAAPIGFYFAVLWYHEELYPLCYGLGGLSALLATGTED